MHRRRILGSVIAAVFGVALTTPTTDLALAQEQIEIPMVPVEFPTRDSDMAIEIAKDVCRGRFDPTLEWHAQLDGVSWMVRSEIRNSGDPMWLVIVPVLGSGPHDSLQCGQSLYHLITIKDVGIEANSNNGE